MDDTSRSGGTRCRQSCDCGSDRAEHFTSHSVIPLWHDPQRSLSARDGHRDFVERSIAGGLSTSTKGFSNRPNGRPASRLKEVFAQRTASGSYFELVAFPCSLSLENSANK